MQCQILLVIHNWIQGNLEGESGNLSEVAEGFSPGTPAISNHHWSSTLNLGRLLSYQLLEGKFEILWTGNKGNVCCDSESVGIQL